MTYVYKHCFIMVFLKVTNTRTLKQSVIALGACLELSLKNELTMTQGENTVSDTVCHRPYETHIDSLQDTKMAVCCIDIYAKIRA